MFPSLISIHLTSYVYLKIKNQMHTYFAAFEPLTSAILNLLSRFINSATIKTSTAEPHLNIAKTAYYYYLDNPNYLGMRVARIKGFVRINKLWFKAFYILKPSLHLFKYFTLSSGALSFYPHISTLVRNNLVINDIGHTDTIYLLLRIHLRYWLTVKYTNSSSPLQLFPLNKL
ncbi:hypothetical protein NQ317_004490 [Molorchus minor]|uniref:Uncharacterized protein n=1 Tax=Molorchus minor TaxID=1323400 RepID=A0ABQ9IXV2_9CUCU|nr:hypothetical protein NQ317_004490 [Molorchus minor]